MSNAVLCVDIGTSSLKAAYLSLKGEVIAFASVKINKADESNRWLFALKEAVLLLNKNIITDSTKKDSLPTIIAISISGNGPSLANSTGAFLWNESLGNLDLRKLPKEANGSIFAPRLFYIKEKMSYLINQSYIKDNYLFAVPEFLIYQLTDRAYTVLPNERYKKAYWSNDLLKVMNIPQDVLPPYLELGKASGNLTERGRNLLNIPKEQLIPLGKNLSEGLKFPPVFCGGPDFTIALIGTNTLSEGKICDRAGTSEGINLCTKEPLISNKIRTLPSPINPFWNASIIIPDTGSRFATWKESSIYKDVSYEKCVDLLLLEKKSEGYKLMQKIALEVKEAYNTIKKIAIEKDIKIDDKICCTGGQAKNQGWLKLKSEIVEIPFYVGKCADAELLGNGAVACYGLGLYASIKEAAEKMTKI